MTESALVKFSRVVDAIYVGAQGAASWRVFLERLKEATNSSYAYMVHGDLQDWARSTWFVEGDGLGAEERIAIRLNYLDLSPFVSLPQDVVTTMIELVNSGHSVPPTFSSMIVQPYGIGDIMGVNFIRRSNQFAAFRVGRVQRASRYTSDDKELCQLALPHLHRAWEKAPMSSNFARKDILSETLQILGVGVFLAGPDRKILDPSPTALEIIDIHRELLTLRNNCLHLQRPQDEQQFDNILRRIISDSSVGVQSLLIGANAGPRRLHFLFRPISEEALSSAPPSVLIFIRDERPSRPLAMQALRGLFGLTPAEARVVCGLVEGLSMMQIAERNNISRNTAYGHLKAVFRKVGVTQQSALVSNILGGIASLGRK